VSAGTWRKYGAQNISSAADTKAAKDEAPVAKPEYMNAPSSQTLSAMLQLVASDRAARGTTSWRIEQRRLQSAEKRAPEKMCGFHRARLPFASSPKPNSLHHRKCSAKSSLAYPGRSSLAR